MFVDVFERARRIEPEIFWKQVERVAEKQLYELFECGPQARVNLLAQSSRKIDYGSVLDHDAFWLARRAGGVDDIREIVCRNAASRVSRVFVGCLR